VFVAVRDRGWLTPVGNSGSFLVRHPNKSDPKNEVFDVLPTDTMIFLKRALCCFVYLVLQILHRGCGRATMTIPQR
jgi:hypothetical protein